jgi:hybrid cluster-associated redox disulfide protein
MSIMIDLETPVDDILNTYPQLGGLFVRMRMLCIGCDIAHFHTLTDVAHVYKIDPVEFRVKLQSWLDENHKTPDENRE